MFEELYSAYVQQPDTSKRSFDQKAADQLEHVTSDARQLFAELYLIDVLPLGNIRAATKIERIDAILDKCDPPFSLAAPSNEKLELITKVLQEGGVFNGGHHAC